MITKRGNDGVQYVFSQYMGKMIPRYVFDVTNKEGCGLYEWNETDLLYYNDAEEYFFYETAAENPDIWLVRSRKFVAGMISKVKAEVEALEDLIDSLAEIDGLVDEWNDACIMYEDKMGELNHWLWYFENVAR